MSFSVVLTDPLWYLLVPFLSSVKRSPNPLWMPKSCTVLKGLQFFIYLVIALDLHCLPSIHLSPSMRCLLHWGLPKNSQHCNCAEAAAWFCLLLVVLCSAIWRLVWAQRPRWCTVSSQLTAIVCSLDYTWWPIFPVSCTCGLLKVFVLRILPNSSLWAVFHKCLVTGLRASGASTQHGLQYVHQFLTELLVCFESVW